MRKIMKLIPALAALVVLAIAVPAFAHNGTDDENSSPSNRSQLAQSKAEEVKQRVQGKLDEKRKQTCEKRVATINRIMTNAATQGTNHLSVFDKISERVQKFYADKGLNVANYSALVAEVNAKKAAATAAIKAVQDGKTFSCDGDNPVGKIDAFNGQIRAMHQALKDYRTAIKNLIVAVKSAAETKEDS